MKHGQTAIMSCIAPLEHFDMGYGEQTLSMAMTGDMPQSDLAPRGSYIGPAQRAKLSKVIQARGMAEPQRTALRGHDLLEFLLPQRRIMVTPKGSPRKEAASTSCNKDISSLCLCSSARGTIKGRILPRAQVQIVMAVVSSQRNQCPPLLYWSSCRAGSDYSSKLGDGNQTTIQINMANYASLY